MLNCNTEFFSHFSKFYSIMSPFIYHGKIEEIRAIIVKIMR